MRKKKKESAMQGIDLNQPLRFRHASLRYFAPGESHVVRDCDSEVLLLVFEGILRFTEDGTAYEIGAGEYFIQKNNTRQGPFGPSDSPKYLYIHFCGHWTEEGEILPRRGTFSPREMMPLMEELDQAGTRNLTEKTALFLQILSVLHGPAEPAGTAKEIASYLREHACEGVSLSELSARFSYSRNQIINLMKKDYGMTPLEYHHRQRLKRAEWLLRVTSVSLAQVSEECGYGEYSQFYKEFFRLHGCSPKEWRETHRR
jgi:AraC-like DNA-binding protein